jgi:hypothetical protein
MSSNSVVSGRTHRRRWGVLIGAIGALAGLATAVVAVLTYLDSKANQDPPGPTRAGIATQAQQPGNSIEGRWASVDLDGSAQTVDVVAIASNTYRVTHHDAYASTCPGGGPVTVSDEAPLSDNTLAIKHRIICPGGRVYQIDYWYRYDPDTDTLTDVNDITWRRAT